MTTRFFWLCGISQLVRPHHTRGHHAISAHLLLGPNESSICTQPASGLPAAQVNTRLSPAALRVAVLVAVAAVLVLVLAVRPVLVAVLVAVVAVLAVLPRSGVLS